MISHPPLPAPSTRLDLGLRPVWLLVLLGGGGGLFLLSLALGSVSIPFDQVLLILRGGTPEKASWLNIVLKFRLPKAITASLAGAALGVSGLMMQTFFKNPLADPFVLGISSGASLGVALVVLTAGTAGGMLLAGFGLAGDLLLVSAAALGAAVSMLLVLVVASRIHNNMTLLILGLMMGYFVSAIVSLLLYFAIPERIQAYLNWTFGSFSSVTWDQLPLLAGGVGVGLSLALVLTKPLNALLLGERYARSLGMNIPLMRLWIVGATALLAGTVTAFCGPIGFIGIAVPHLCRNLLRTSDHRMLVPASILMGAMLALLVALIAELPGSELVLPLNAVTVFIGAPIVIFVIVRQHHAHETFNL